MWLRRARVAQACLATFYANALVAHANFAGDRIVLGDMQGGVTFLTLEGCSMNITLFGHYDGLMLEEPGRGARRSRGVGAIDPIEQLTDSVEGHAR